MPGIWQRFFGSSVSTAAGFGMGAALGPALRPVTQAVANETWAQFPNRPLTPDEAADAVVRAVMGLDEAQREALASGINAERFAAMVELAGDPPAVEQTLSLWNRGVIGEDRVDEALRQSGLKAEWLGPVKALRTMLVPFSDTIRLAVREVFSPSLRQTLDLDADYPSELTDRARSLGLSEQAARDLWAGHWDLPSYTQATEMLFRGEISRAEFTSLLRALDYAPRWRGPLEAIARRIPTMQDFQRLVRREVYNPAQRQQLGLDAEYPAAFTEKAALHGMSEQDARDLWAGGWRLPSALQGYRMLWRGEIDEGELDGLLKALDYPPLWRDRLANIARLVPGRIDLRRMFAAGVIDRAEVKRGYQRLGYSEPDAETLTRFAEQQAASGGEAHQKWADRARSRLFTVAHNEYLDESLDRAAADAALDVVGVPAGERAAVFAAWDREREISRLELTPAQVRKAYAANLWTQQQALDALAARGMSREDATVYLEA